MLSRQQPVARAPAKGSNPDWPKPAGSTAAFTMHQPIEPCSNSDNHKQVSPASHVHGSHGNHDRRSGSQHASPCTIPPAAEQYNGLQCTPASSASHAGSPPQVRHPQSTARYRANAICVQTQPPTRYMFPLQARPMPQLLLIWRRAACQLATKRVAPLPVIVARDGAWRRRHNRSQPPSLSLCTCPEHRGCKPCW